MLMSEAFPSKYVSAPDLKGREVTVTISHVVMEELQGNNGTQYKPVVYFQGAAKGMVLNKTNSTTIASEFGDESDNWTNRQLVLFTVKTQNQSGQLVDGIRCRCVQVPAANGFVGQLAEQPASQKETPAPIGEPDNIEGSGSATNGINDSIPF